MPLVYATPLRAAAPPAETITPALIAAATKEGQVTWYTSADLQLAEKVGKAFEQKFPGIRVRVERAGGERIFSRVAQEYASGLHVADAVSTGDAAQFLAWKRQKLLAPYVPEDVARHIPPEHRDPDGFYATVRSSLCVMAYNTEMVKRDEAPKSFADLLDPKWKGKIVKAHPSYSGTIMTSTYQMVRELGWPYLEKLAQQQVLQIQSATDTPKKIVLGERPVMADGNESNVLLLKESGQADRSRLCDRRHALDRATLGDFCRGAASECCAAFPELSVQCRRAGAFRQSGRPALDACAGEGQAGPHAVIGDQGVEGRSRRGRGAGRGDQAALFANLQGLIMNAQGRGSPPRPSASQCNCQSGYHSADRGPIVASINSWLTGLDHDLRCSVLDA